MLLTNSPTFLFLALIKNRVGLIIGETLRFEYRMFQENSKTINSDLITPEIKAFAISSTEAEDVELVSRGKVVIIPCHNPPFPSPLFHSLLFVFFLVLVPALVLSFPSFWHLYEDQVNLPLAYNMFGWIVVLPPALWALFAVPAVLLVLVRWREDGHMLMDGPPGAFVDDWVYTCACYVPYRLH